MAHIQFFDKLVSLPLFTGMSKAEVETTIEKTKFEFHKVAPGDIVVERDDRGGQIVLLVDGEVELETMPDDRGYSVVERMVAPMSVMLQHTFGLTQRYASTVRAVSPCNFLSVSKNEALRLTSDSLIFRLNLLNILSTSLQKSIHNNWRPAPQSLRERICRFFLVHSLRPSGPKLFLISMERLAEELNDTRRNISTELNAMKQEGLLKLGRGRIEILALEKLIGA